MEQTSMDDILSDAKPEKPAPDAPAAPTESKAEGASPVERVTSRRAEHRRKELTAQGRDPDTGQFVKKEEAEAAAPEAKAPEKKPEAAEKPPTQEMTAKEKAAFAAVQDERRKRQALEQQIAAMRQAPPQQQPAPNQADGQSGQPRKFWDDPEAALAEYHGATVSQAQHIAITARISTSEMLARHRHEAAGDYDTNIEVFKELAQSTPGVMQQWLQSPDPAEFAYRAGKMHRELREVGSLEGLRAKMEKELRLKIETEFKEKEEAARKERAAIPPTLSDVRGASQQHRPQFAGPTPMSDILKR